MSCNIFYQDGKIIKVLDDSGQPSKLYKEAVDKFGEEKGLEMYLVSKSNSFLDFFMPKNQEGISVGEYLENNQLPSVEETLFLIEDEESRQGGTLITDEFEQGRFETREQALEYAKEVNSVLDSFYTMQEIPVYRAVKADEVDLDPYGIGESWSFDINGAKQFGSYNGSNRIISGFVPRGNVDWEQAIRNYISFSDISDGDSEFELPISSNNRINNVIVQNIKSAKERVKQTEPTLQEVTNYVASNNKTDLELNKNQKSDLINVLISTPNFKAEDFYDEFGMFVIPKKYYSRYELMTINEAEVKQAVDALLNTEFAPNIETVENAQKINEKNAFGKLVSLNPNIVKKEAIKAIVLSDESEGIESLLEEAKSYKKADVLIETLDGEIIPAKNTNTEQILPLVVKENFKTDLIDNLQNLSLNTLQKSEEQTKIVLKAIENDLISQGIDAIGLSDKSIDQDLLDYLNTAKTFINSPTKENTKTFAEKSDTYFERNITPKKDIVKSDKTDRTYVKLNTNKTEEELYESKGLIQSELGKGIYIQTAKESLEELYNNLRTYTEKYPKDTTLEKYVQEQITKQDSIYNNAENAEAIFLYKMYFGVGQNLIKDKNGNLLAPNGKISNLNEEQWKLVRTPEFISWFGDWQNEPQNASKVVDENGEPRVLYHSTSEDFTEFDSKFIGKNYTPHYGAGFYFADSYRGAVEYGGKLGFYFINVKNLKEYSYGLKYEGQEKGFEDVADYAKSLDIDGLVYGDNYKQYIVFYPSQIKSATEIKGVTTEDTNDIRYLTKRPQYNNTTKQFVGNYNYLTEDYVSDFYIEQLKEKQKNSAKYRNFYSNFEVNEKGINLLSTDDITMQQIEIYADNNLRQYSLISKQIPDLEVEEVNENQRDLIVNNPQTLENYKKDLFRVNEDTIILKDNVETFIKVNDEIYENVEVKGNLSTFAKIKVESEAKDYYQYNIKPPKTNIRLSDYNYLSTQEELFTSPKKYLNKEEKNQIKNDKFNC